MPYNTRQAILSSPDPLNDSPAFSSTVKPHAASMQEPLNTKRSSPRKRTFRLDVGDKLSPQRIRVTVEAEHFDDNNNKYKNLCNKDPPSPTQYRVPAVHQAVRTTTTTVPVKGLSDSEDDASGSPSQEPKRGRGRPKKTFDTPVPAKSRNRVVTPGAKLSPRKRRTLGDLVDGDDPEDWDFAIGARVEVGGGKGRPRSRSAKGRNRNKHTPATKQISSLDKTAYSTSSGKGRGRGKSLASEEIIIHKDEVTTIPNFTIENRDQGQDTRRVLAQQDLNAVPTQSGASASLSRTTIRNGDPGPLLDMSSAVKSPTKAGWSSPRILSATSPSTISGIRVPSAGTASSAKPQLQHIMDGKVGNKDSDEITHASNNFDEMEIGEIQEFDTILESEGFSMISVDSVPSLREHLSSPLDLNETGPKSESIIVDGGVSRLKNDSCAYPEDYFLSIAPEISETAKPRRKALNLYLRAVRSANNLEDGESFSSIPPNILEAATSGRQRSSSKFASLNVQERRCNNDSFSSIAPAILEAATPAKHLLTGSNSEAQSTGKEELKLVAALPSADFHPLSDVREHSRRSSGLLTPNETPSPLEIAVQQPGNTDYRESCISCELNPSKLLLTEGCSTMNSQMRSSPPSAAPCRTTCKVDLFEQKLLYPNLTETPSIAFSSPSLPPLIQNLPHKRSKISLKLDSIESTRLSLSPIVRAGRVLQNIATSPSRSRTQSLGSPFKSPSTQRNSVGMSGGSVVSTNFGGKAQKPWEKNKGTGSDIFASLSDDTQGELRKSMIMGDELTRNQNYGAQITNPISAIQVEDPFQNNLQSTNSPSSPEEGKEYILGLPSQGPGLPSGLERSIGQYQNLVHGESAMSWQAESAGILHNSANDASTAVDDRVQEDIFEMTELLAQHREAEWARQRAAVSAQIDSASTSQVIVINSDPPEDCASFRSEVDDVEDIWQAEARHSSSLLEEQAASIPPVQEPLEKPRRSKIPNPGRKNGKRPVYNNKPVQSSRPPPPEKPNDLPSRSQPKAKRDTAQITVRKRVFTQDITEGEDLPEPSIVWHIPQKLNFAPRPRNSGNLDLSALFASSPPKIPPSACQADSKLRALVVDASQDNLSKSADVEVADISTGMPRSKDSRVNLLDPTERRSASTNNGIQDENTMESSYQESEQPSESSHVDARVHYPTLPNITLPSPQKSCLRTPTSTSPTKSVAFVSPTPSPPPLSSTTWSKAHWKLLNAIYQDSKPMPTTPSAADSKTYDALKSKGSKEPSKYLGKTIYARGVSLTLGQWHLDIVADFMEEVPGWDEGVIAKRLFAIIVGEESRKQGKT